MKKIKNLIAIFMCATMLVSSSNTTVYAASTEPYSEITYSYSERVSAGSFRYISQFPESSKFHAEYWGKFSSLGECGTASMSMALSYIGLDVTPFEILNKYNGSTVFGDSWGGINPQKDYTKSTAKSAFDAAWDKYVNGDKQYSPPIIHINGKSSNVYYKNGHFMLVIGKNADGSYQILDPYDGTPSSSVWNATISDGKIKIQLGTKAAEWRPFADVRQYRKLLHEETPEPEPVPEPEAPAPEPVPEPQPETPAPEPIPESQPEAPTPAGEFVLKTMDVDSNSITENSALVCAKYENPLGLHVTKTGYKYGTDANNLASEVYFSANITKTSGQLNTRTISGLTPGTKYYFCPVAISGEMIFYGDVKSFTTKGAAQETEESQPEVKAPEKPIISSVANAVTGMTIKWTKVSGASGYYLYRKNADGKYEKIKTITSGSTVSYNDKDANTSGNTYSYKLYAYKKDNDTVAKSPASAVKSYVRVGTVSSLSASSPSTKKIKLSYKKVSKASGYQIQYAASSDYSNSLKVTTTAVSKTLTTSKKKTTYYVRVRAKIVKASTTYWGAWSSKKINVK